MAKSSDDGAFAKAVIEIFKARAEGDAPKRIHGHEERQVAYGLFALWQAARHFHKRMEDDQDPGSLAGSGFPDAIGILEAFTTGHDHPIWKHIDSLRTATFRPQNAPPVAIQRKRHELVVGLVRALQQAGNTKEFTAIREVSSGVISNDFSFTVPQIRGWVRRENGDEFCKIILSEAKTLEQDPGFSRATLVE
jgi:hypothetical protein